jgi:hypothetical protein
MEAQLRRDRGDDGGTSVVTTAAPPPPQPSHHGHALGALHRSDASRHRATVAMDEGSTPSTSAGTPRYGFAFGVSGSLNGGDVDGAGDAAQSNVQMTPRHGIHATPTATPSPSRSKVPRPLASVSSTITDGGATATPPPPPLPPPPPPLPVAGVERPVCS